MNRSAARRIHWVVAWLKVGTDANGEPVVEEQGRELNVRFDSTRREMAGPDGLPIVVDATMSEYQVDVPPGSAVWRGRAAELAPNLYMPSRDVMRVATASADSDYRGRYTYREAGLTFSRGSLPSTPS